SAGKQQGFLTKLDASGNFLWADAIAPGAVSRVFGLAADSSGNAYVAGDYSGTGTFGSVSLTSVSGTRDAFVSAVDGGGNVLWAHSLGGSGDDSAAAVTVDGNANVYVGGHFQGTANLDPGAGTFHVTSG